MTQSTPKASMTSTERYEQDYYLWLHQTTVQLRSRSFASLDIDNLVEEIEAMGRGENVP